MHQWVPLPTINNVLCKELWVWPSVVCLLCRLPWIYLGFFQAWAQNFIIYKSNWNWKECRHYSSCNLVTACCAVCGLVFVCLFVLKHSQATERQKERKKWTRSAPVHQTLTSNFFESIFAWGKILLVRQGSAIATSQANPPTNLKMSLKNFFQYFTGIEVQYLYTFLKNYRKHWNLWLWNKYITIFV